MATGLRRNDIVASWFGKFHYTVWLIVVTTGVTKTTQFMVIPFVALYMAHYTHASPATIGLAVGMNALTGTAVGYFGGWLSDTYGRKPLMVVAMLINVVAMIGFANARIIWMFFLMSAISGITRSVFGPTSRAALTDILKDDQLSTVFALNYWFLNVGAALGPILGGYLGSSSNRWVFLHSRVRIVHIRGYFIFHVAQFKAKSIQL